MGNSRETPRASALRRDKEGAAPIIVAPQKKDPNSEAAKEAAKIR